MCRTVQHAITSYFSSRKYLTLRYIIYVFSKKMVVTLLLLTAIDFHGWQNPLTLTLKYKIKMSRIVIFEFYHLSVSMLAYRGHMSYEIFSILVFLPITIYYDKVRWSLFRQPFPYTSFSKFEERR